MPTETMTPRNEEKRLWLSGPALAVVVVLAIAGAGLQIVGWRTAWDESRRVFAAFLESVAHAGPAAFFAAMALLPAVGAPMAPFAMMAGAVFREQLGLPLLLLSGVTAITLNLALTYWLARRWLRPLLARVLARFGYALPRVETGDTTDLIVLLRVTPGVPFFVQNYLLGLADVPFLRYLAISCGIQWIVNVALMLFADALSRGRGRLALTAILLLLAVAAGTHLVRKHVVKKTSS